MSLLLGRQTVNELTLSNTAALQYWNWTLETLIILSIVKVREEVKTAGGQNIPAPHTGYWRNNYDHTSTTHGREEELLYHILKITVSSQV